MNRTAAYAIALMIVGLLIAGSAHGATIPASVRAEIRADRILNHHPYLDAYMDANPIIAVEFIHVANRYPHRMRHLIARRSYDRWLLHWLRSRGGLPGIDLLLGA